MAISFLRRGRPSLRVRASSRTAFIPAYPSQVQQLPRYSLLAPVVYSKGGGSTNLSVSTGGLITATAAIAPGATQQINGTAVGNDGCVVPWSMTLTGVAAVPLAPTIELTPGDGEILVTVTDGEDGGDTITHHRVYLGLSAGALALYGTFTAAASHTIAPLANGVPHYVKVSSVNSVGEGAQSALADAPPVSAPAQVTDLLAFGGDGVALLTWTAPDDGGAAISDYEVRHSLTSEETWASFADGVSTAPGATVTGLANGAARDFQVRAVNSVGPGSWSNTATATPDVAPPAALDSPHFAVDLRTNAVTLTSEPQDGVVYELVKETVVGPVVIDELDVANSYAAVATSAKGTSLRIRATRDTDVVYSDFFLLDGNPVLDYEDFTLYPHGTDLHGYDGWTAGATGRFVVESGVVANYYLPGSTNWSSFRRDVDPFTGRWHSAEVKIKLNSTTDTNSRDWKRVVLASAGGTRRIDCDFSRTQVQILIRNISGGSTVMDTGLVTLSPSIPQDAMVRFSVNRIDSNYYVQMYVGGKAMLSLNSGKGYDITSVIGTILPNRCVLASHPQHNFSGSPLPYLMYQTYEVRDVNDATFFLSIDSLSAPVGETPAQAVVSGFYSGTITNVQVAWKDAATGEQLTDWEPLATSGSNTLGTHVLDMPPVLFNRRVMLCVRDTTNYASYDETPLNVPNYAYMTLTHTSESYDVSDDVVVTLHGTYHGMGVATVTAADVQILDEVDAAVVALGAADSFSFDGLNWQASCTVSNAAYDALIDQALTFRADLTFSTAQELTASYESPYLAEWPQGGVGPLRVGMNVNSTVSWGSTILAKDLTARARWSKHDYSGAPSYSSFTNFVTDYQATNTQGAIALLFEGGQHGDDAEFEITVSNLALTLTILPSSNVALTQAWNAATGTLRFRFTPEGDKRVRTRGLSIKVTGPLTGTETWSILPVVDPNPGKDYYHLLHSAYAARGVSLVRPMTAMSTNDNIGAAVHRSVDLGAQSSHKYGFGTDMLMEFSNDLTGAPWHTFHDVFGEQGVRAVAKRMIANREGRHGVYESSNEVWNKVFNQHWRHAIAAYQNGRWLGTTFADAVAQPALAANNGAAPWWTIKPWVTNSQEISGEWFHRLYEPMQTGDIVVGGVSGIGTVALQATMDLPANLLFSSALKNQAGDTVFTILVGNENLSKAVMRENAMRLKSVIEWVIDEFNDAGVSWQDHCRFVLNCQTSSSAAVAIDAIDYAGLWDYPVIPAVAPYPQNRVASPASFATIEEFLDARFGGNIGISAAGNVSGYATSKISEAASFRNSYLAAAASRGKKVPKPGVYFYEIHTHHNDDLMSAYPDHHAGYVRNRRAGIEMKVMMTAAGVKLPGVPFTVLGDIAKEATNWSVDFGTGEYDYGTASGNRNPVGICMEEWKVAHDTGVPSFDVYTKEVPPETGWTAYILRSGPLSGTQEVAWEFVPFSGTTLTGSVTFTSGQQIKTVELPAVAAGIGTFSLTGVTGSGVIGSLSDEVEITVQAVV